MTEEEFKVIILYSIIKVKFLIKKFNPKKKNNELHINNKINKILFKLKNLMI